MIVSNKRQPGESFADYRERLRQVNRGIRTHLRRGVPAGADRDGNRYLIGLHPSHAPHQVTEKVLDKRTGEMVDLVVNHPGTLTRSK